MNAQILEILHRSSQVDVLDVDAHVFCVVFGALDGAVDMDFCVEEGDCRGAWVPRIIEIVTSFCKAYAMCL